MLSVLLFLRENKLFAKRAQMNPLMQDIGKRASRIALAILTGILCFLIAGIIATNCSGTDSYMQQKLDTRSKIESLEKRLEEYRVKEGHYPKDQKALADLRLISPEQDMIDGWKRSFRYSSTGKHMKISSTGPDGKFDTKDDITN